MDREYHTEVDIDSVCLQVEDEMIARCIHCGYGIHASDEAAVVQSNGGAIHRDCWEEYASENAQEFLSDIVDR